MELRELLVSKLAAYREEHNLTTYSLRKIERAKQPKPVGGVNVTTLNAIRDDPNFIPGKSTIKKLLVFFDVEFEETINGINIKEHADGNNN